MSLIVITSEDVFSHGDEIDFNYDPNIDNPELHNYCTVVEENGNDRMCGTVTTVTGSCVHFTTPYSDEPLYIDFKTKELHATGDTALLGSNVRVVVEEDDIQANISDLELGQYSPLPDVE